MTDDLRVPDEIGKIEGYRVFRAKGGRLWPLSQSDLAWKPGVNEAFCVGGYHAEVQVLRNTPEGVVSDTVPTHGLIPDPNCHCGFWLYPNPAKMKKYLRHHLPKGTSHTKGHRLSSGYGDFSGEEEDFGVVPAKVAGWGRVVEGTDGCRVEFAEVMHLISNNPPDGLVHLAETYHVPIVDDPALAEAEQKTLVRGEIVQIGARERSRSSGRWRPRRVYLELKKDQIETLLVWPESREEKKVLDIGGGVTVQVHFEEDTNFYDGETQRWLKQITKIEEDD